jgi:hypothetical protein
VPNFAPQRVLGDADFLEYRIGCKRRARKLDAFDTLNIWLGDDAELRHTLVALAGDLVSEPV